MKPFSDVTFDSGCGNAAQIYSCCLFVTVSSPSDYDTAPDVMEPVDTPVLRSESLV